VTAHRPLTRRLAPLLVGLGVGLGALTVALVALAGTFAAERRDALAAARAERTALERYASAALAQRVTGALDEARELAAAAVADPLVDPEGLVLFRDGEQLLPRPAGPVEPTSTGLRDYRGLVAGVLPDADGPWRERGLLLAGLREALARQDDASVAAGARDLLRHIAHYRLRADRDLASLLAFVDRFLAEGRPSGALLGALLRDGLTLNDGARIEPLQRALIAARPRLSGDDFAALAERIGRLSERAGVPHGDFDAAAARPAGDPLDLPRFEVPTVTASGLALDRTEGGVVGRRVALTDMAAALTDEMRRGGLLAPDEALVATAPPVPTPVGRLAAEVRSGRWAAATEAAERQFSYKTALLLGAGFLALLLAALAVMLQVKKARYLALRSHFVSAVSHELRTPLASIGLLAETLERRLAGRPEARDYPTRILRDAHGMGLLVDNILSFNRLEHGHWRPRRSAITVADLLDVVAADARAHARRPVIVTTEAAPGLGLEGDPELLRLALSNLTRNAITYGVREPVRVHLVASTDDRSVTLVVEDNGPGIPEAERAQVFREFQRGGAASGTRGSGLGLAICRRVAALHGGRAGLRESNRDGSSFFVAIPQRERRSRRAA